MKKLLFICGLLWSVIASAQFTSGQLLTAQELNSQFANTLPLAGGTLTGPLTVPSLSVTGTPISLASGGTGATTATGALANLGGLPSNNPVTSGATTIGGGILFKRRTIGGSTSSDTATVLDAVINWNSSASSNKAESIPACTSPIDGQKLVVKDEIGTSSTYSIVITPASGTIEKKSTFSINSNYGSSTFFCDASATNWTAN